MFSISREFSPCGKYCAYISQQGKFVVHDVETSDIHQVYTPNMHLNVPCTSFAWFQVGGDAPAKTKKKSKKARASVGENVQLLVAFGTSKGGVAFYSLATASIERSCKGDGHTAPITAIYFNASHNPDTLYTAGADGKVIEWSISQCKQQKVHHIGVEKLSCVLAHGDKILTGAKQLKLWDAESGTVERTLAGHTANTQLLQLISLDEEHVYALSGSVNDRNLSLWSLSDEDATSAVAAFALDDVPEYIAPKIVDRKLHLVAVSRTGVAHYFVRDMGKLSVKKPYRAAHTFEIAVFLFLIIHLLFFSCRFLCFSFSGSLCFVWVVRPLSLCFDIQINLHNPSPDSTIPSTTTSLHVCVCVCVSIVICQMSIVHDTRHCQLISKQ